MAMNVVYRDALANAAAGMISELALFDPDGKEVARAAVAWAAPDKGLLRPAKDIIFRIAAGRTIAGWRALSMVGVDFGGSELPVETFTGEGTYTLLADKTGIAHRI